MQIHCPARFTGRPPAGARLSRVCGPPAKGLPQVPRPCHRHDYPGRLLARNPSPAGGGRRWSQGWSRANGSADRRNAKHLCGLRGAPGAGAVSVLRRPRRGERRAYLLLDLAQRDLGRLLVHRLPPRRRRVCRERVAEPHREVASRSARSSARRPCDPACRRHGLGTSQRHVARKRGDMSDQPRSGPSAGRRRRRLKAISSQLGAARGRSRWGWWPRRAASVPGPGADLRGMADGQERTNLGRRGWAHSGRLVR